MTIIDDLKNANVNIHIIATGAGAGIQKQLWEVPGSSAYLSGASFPYDQTEQEELLGFTPEQFCSETAAIDLASAAYMKAFKFGGKNPVGVGLTASVASEKEHRGDHRNFVCVITNDKVISLSGILQKGSGKTQRINDGNICDETAIHLLLAAIYDLNPSTLKDVTALAEQRFFSRPYFDYTGKRYGHLFKKNAVLMPGAYNPPHAGHFGMADEFEAKYPARVIFNTTVNPPHKAALSVQDCLKRAKMLQGRDRFFSKDDPLYLDKARNNPGMPILLGADSLIRTLDPKWGVPTSKLLEGFKECGTKLYVTGRMIDDKFVSGWDAVSTLHPDLYAKYSGLFCQIDGRWDISSTEIRNKM